MVNENLTYSLSPEDIAYFETQHRKRVRSIVAKTFVYIALCIWAFFAIFPIVWVFMSSFKRSNDVLFNSLNPMFETWTMGGYERATQTNIDILSAYWNSLYTSAICVVLCLVVSIMMAFCLARFKFPGNRILEVLVVACMMFPAFAMITPLYSVYDELFLFDTHLGYVLPQIALNMSFTTILLTGFFRSLPIEVEESAFLDGASLPRTLIQIVLPMMKSAIITCVIFIFLWTYNDLFVQNFAISDSSKRMLPGLMNYVTNRGGQDYSMTCAVAALIAVPMLIVYFVLQKHIIKGLTAGAVKG